MAESPIISDATDVRSSSPDMECPETSQLVKTVSTPSDLNANTLLPLSTNTKQLSSFNLRARVAENSSQLQSTEEHNQLLHKFTARKNKFIIIPASTPNTKVKSHNVPTLRLKGVKNPINPPVTRASTAPVLLRRHLQNRYSSTTLKPSIPEFTATSLTSLPPTITTETVHQRRYPTSESVTAANIIFTIDDFDCPPTSAVDGGPISRSNLISSISITKNFTPSFPTTTTPPVYSLTPVSLTYWSTSSSQPATPLSTLAAAPRPLSAVITSATAVNHPFPSTELSSAGVGTSRLSSMRSLLSAYLTDSPDLTVQSLYRQRDNRRLPKDEDWLADSSSFLLRDRVANQLYSDVTSVKSLASIGIGSTDGHKLVIKRVPQSPSDLLNFYAPPPPPTPENVCLETLRGVKQIPQAPPNLPGTPEYGITDEDDDDDSFMDGTDEMASLKPRQQYWANKMQFVLACIGYSVGLGNVWRFPYMCYKSGGGVFLVPYCIILIVCSIPLLFMELAVGQYTGRGPIGALGQLCPLFKGAGVASVVVSFLMSTYYSVIIAYSIYYFFTAFRSNLPWIDCKNRWNTPDCWIPQRATLNITSPDTSRTPTEEFFENKVLQISPGIEYPGAMRWELFACLICAWLLVYFATWKSIKSSAKVRYFTATFPFILIVILMCRAVTLEGASNGLRYFFRPDWKALKNANVWINAASQNFNSLGITFGSMISFASYNRYNNNILHDTIAVSCVNVLTSLLVGIFAFATLGNLALEQNTNVRDVIGDGPGLIFVVYPQAMVKMPYAQLWAVMFFFMLLCLGLNSQFAIVEVVVTSIQDGFPRWIKRHLGYHEIVVLFVCLISFLFGLPNLIQSGIYYFQLMDHYTASITIMFLAFCQMISIAWFYSIERLSKNVKQMTGKAPSLYLKSCWIMFGPCLLFAIWILSLINYEEPSYHNGRYKYPNWAYGIGWTFASISLACIPGYAILNLCRANGQTFSQRLKVTLHPNIYECKICGEHHCEHNYAEQEQYMLSQEMAHVYKTAQFPVNYQTSTYISPDLQTKEAGYNLMHKQKNSDLSDTEMIASCNGKSETKTNAKDSFGFKTEINESNAEITYIDQDEYENASTGQNNMR